jgi:hypothetical protein
MDAQIRFSPEFWAIIGVGLFIFFAIRELIAQVGRLQKVASELHAEASSIELHLSCAPWVEAKAQRDSTYWGGDS